MRPFSFAYLISRMSFSAWSAFCFQPTGGQLLRVERTIDALLVRGGGPRLVRADIARLGGNPRSARPRLGGNPRSAECASQCFTAARMGVHAPFTEQSRSSGSAPA